MWHSSCQKTWQKIPYSMFVFVLLGLGIPQAEGKVEGQVEKQIKAQAESLSGELLVYVEQDQGNDPVTVTLFATEHYLRISDDVFPEDFILLKRDDQTIYNVRRSDQSILVIRKKPIPAKPPMEIIYEERLQPDDELPKIDARKVKHYRYFANGQLCYDAVLLPDDFMPQALMAMREFRLVLAGQHAGTVDTIPKNMLDACDLALNIYQATQHMEHGLPVREWGRDGYQRYLKDYRMNAIMPPDAFELPKGFRQFSIGD